MYTSKQDNGWSKQMIINYNGYMVGQSGKLATCPFCLEDMCGCYDCLEVKKFLCCKGCTESYRMDMGRYPTKAVVRAAIKRLVSLGMWDAKSHKAVA